MAASGAFKSGLGRALFGEMGAGQIAGRLAPDAIFGGMAAMQTPGDLGDKLIAGTSTAVGGAVGGIGALVSGSALLGAEAGAPLDLETFGLSSVVGAGIGSIVGLGSYFKGKIFG